ncbi:MAG TPA: phosphotransferase [Chloroflexota bacterium]|nr:phosphotransferase [Chloroflexota bacterium]
MAPDDHPDSLPDPRRLWPNLMGWDEVGMAERVYRVSDPSGGAAYLRPDDGSAPLLRRLASQGLVPAPRVLDVRNGWLLLEALPGIPLHVAATWLQRPHDVIRIAGEALRSLQRAGVTHGDMCLPNILGDPATGRLTGIVDWRYAGRFDREIDIASAVWSCGFNGHGEEVALGVLQVGTWPRVDATEVARLCQVWIDLTEPFAAQEIGVPGPPVS